jgi:hypothetical protein
MNICGLRVGWTFWIGIIPGAGDVVNAILNYLLVVRVAKRAEIPGWLLHQMLLNNAVSSGVGLVPIVGDLVLAVYKANSRNAHLSVVPTSERQHPDHYKLTIRPN